MFQLFPPFESCQNRILLQEGLRCVAQEYKHDMTTVSQEDGYWLFATHPTYGIIGGICLTPPSHLHPSSNKEDPIMMIASTLKSGWLASHLFFRLPDDSMDELTDAELSQILHTFYLELYKSLKTFCNTKRIHHFWMVVPAEQYMAAVAFGNYQFEMQMPFVKKETEYMASVLPMDRQSQDTFLHYQMLSNKEDIKFLAGIH